MPDDDEHSSAISGDPPLPRPGEPIHLPDPSYLPVLVALGVTIVLVGVVLNWVICGLGVAITLVVVLRWVGQTRRDMSHLPLEL